MKLYAHRGFRAAWPENTLLSFEKAIATGCGAIELDVQLSLDGELVVIHDETVDRTTSGSGQVAGMTLAELQALDTGGGQRIPTLEEYFELLAGLPGGGGVVTNIELKNSVIPYPGMEEKVLTLVRRYGHAGRVLFSSFNHSSVVLCKQLAPEIPCGFLCGGRLDTAGVEAVAAKMKQHGVEYLHPSLASLTEAVLEKIKLCGLSINVWTVNDPAAMERLAAFGAAGIFTDDPALAMETLSR